MIDPRYWLPHRRARQAVVGYPLYTVPHPQSERTLDPALARENFDHFTVVRLERLTAFRAWLRRHFGVAAPLDESGLQAVDAWVERYGGGLVSNFSAMNNAFASYRPAWEGPFAGCNVMVDVAIFIGEYLIAQRPHLRWICSLDCLKYSKPNEVSNLGRPCIGGFPYDPYTVDVFQMGAGGLLDAERRSVISYTPFLFDRHIMIEVCRQACRIADGPDDEIPVIF